MSRFTDSNVASSSAIKGEILRGYKTVRRIDDVADELILRGEAEGSDLRAAAYKQREDLDRLRTALLTKIGEAERLKSNAADYIKRQSGVLNPIDSAIEKDDWRAAYEAYGNGLDAADTVALFVDEEMAEEIYGPIEDRAVKILPSYYRMRKSEIVPQLQQEYTTIQPDLLEMGTVLDVAVTQFTADQRIALGNKKLSGPEFLHELADAWENMDRQVVQSVSLLQAIGTAASDEVKRVRSQYDTSRAKVFTIISGLISAESADADAAEIERRYLAYLKAIPPLLSAVRSSSGDVEAAVSALDTLAKRAPDFAQRIERYREATSESVRWQKLIGARKLEWIHDHFAHAATIGDAMMQPIRVDGKSVRRYSATTWQRLQSPQSLASRWTKNWSGYYVRMSDPVLQSSSKRDAKIVGRWYVRASIESSLPGTVVDTIVRQVSHVYLCDERGRPPLTLEAAVAMHSARHGPYVESGGAVERVFVENLPDRLWDDREPLDVQGALNPTTLTDYPGIPAFVRLQVSPTWVAHDVCVWSVPLPERRPAAQGAGRSRGERTRERRPSSRRPGGGKTTTAPDGKEKPKRRRRRL